LGSGNLRQKISFDLKISRLLGTHWDRSDLKHLATQLLDEQGNVRISFENRITIMFDGSTTSSVPFFELNRTILWRKFIQLIFNPEEYWHWISEHQCWHATILINKHEYCQINENHSQVVGEGLREPEKAVFATSFLAEVAKDSQGLLEINSNDKEHGIDGWIWLPTEMLERK
jgi:hypothetical protein